MLIITKSGFLAGIRWSYLPNPSARVGYDTKSIFKQSLTGLNSEFSFSKTSCFTKAEEPSLSYYLPIAGGRIIGFIPFPRVLVLCEMQSISSRIWTRVAVSISYDNNHYTTGTTRYKVIRLYLQTPQIFFAFHFSRTDSGLYIYHLAVYWFRFNGISTFGVYLMPKLSF